MDFTKALDTAVDKFEPPKMLPIGTYTWTVIKVPENKVVGKNEDWDMLTFYVKCVAPEDDVDPDDLEEFGKVTGAMNRVTFLFPKAADEQVSWDRTMMQLKNFLYNVLNVDVPEDALLSEALAATPNSMFLGVVKHVPDKNDASIVREEIGSTAPIS